MDRHDSLSGKVFNYVGSTTISFNETLFNYMEVTNWMIVLYKLFQGSIVSYVSQECFMMLIMFFLQYPYTWIFHVISITNTSVKGKTDKPHQLGLSF